MSIEALRWAYKQSHNLNSTSKFVLTTLGDYADEDNCAYPSHQTISSKTLLDPKTVMISLQRLAKHGFIQDTGERKGRTGHVKVYQLSVLTHPKTDTLNTSENGYVQTHPKTDNLSRNISKNGYYKHTQKRITDPPVGNYKSTEKRNQLSNFVEFLKEDTRFCELDVEGEVARAVEWYKKKNRPVTERLLENWLLHAEQPLEEDEEEVGSLASEDYFSWEGWTDERRRALRELWPGAAEPPQRWDKSSPDIKEQIEARVKEGWA